MHPHFAHLADLSSWAVLGTVATVVAAIVALTLLRRGPGGLRPAETIEFAVITVAGGWLAAKIGHVLFEARGHQLPDGTVANGVIDLLRADPWHWARLLEPGFVQLAGLLGGAVLGVIYLRRLGRQDALPVVADAAVVAVVVGVAIGRVGCFLAGCCYGAPTAMPWGVQFPVGHPTHGMVVHPTQLYDVGGAVVAIAVWALCRHRRARPGTAAMVVTIVMLAERFASEWFRGDADRGLWGPLSTSQWLALIVGLLALAVLWRRRHSPPSPPSPSGPDDPSTFAGNPLS